MSAIEPPPTKRKRAEDPIDEPPFAELVRSDVWYEDGNVILQAENTQFKVHKSLLAQNSSVFADMFSFPQPPTSDAASTVDTCPIVCLAHDTAEEVGYLLKALFRNECVSLPIQSHIAN